MLFIEGFYICQIHIGNICYDDYTLFGPLGWEKQVRKELKRTIDFF